MKLLATTLCLLALGLGTAAPSWAVDPTPGTYNSTDIGGAVLTGRGTQSWNSPLNAAQGLGDVFNSQSWDGATLGTQWRISCGVQTAPQVKEDNRVAGTGSVIFRNVFVGGSFFLSKTGPWGDGINDLTGTLGITRVDVTVVYVNNVPQASRANISSDGVFNGSNCTLTFVIANGIGGGDTDLMPKPPGYPDFLETSCAPTRIYGSWGDINEITMRIDCPVPSRQSTWGKVKSIYR